MSRSPRGSLAARTSAENLHDIIMRLASAGSGIVMIAPGYSRGELVADLRAIEANLRSPWRTDPPDQLSTDDDR
jgi:hypothetical protein